MRNSRTHQQKVRRDRLGASIIIVIAFYAIAMTMIGIWMRSALRQHQVVRRWHEKTQALWLAEAGVGRAVARLQADRDYRGERWQIAANQLDDRLAAEVEIRVEAEKDANEIMVTGFRIVAVARLPAGDLTRAQATKTTDYRLSPAGEVPGESS